jgi:murein DD-endopeptidase MepM/ murein hydrolase activator NlpD
MADPSGPVPVDPPSQAPPAVAQEPSEPEPDPTRGQVQPGDNLSRLLRRAGLDPTTSHRLAIALATVTDPATLQPGQTFRLELGDSGAFKRFELQLSRTDLAVVEPDDKGLLRARQQSIPTETRTVQIGLQIETSLWAAMISAGIEPSLVDRIADVFAYDVNFFTDTRVGDTIRLVVDRVETVSDTPPEPGELVRWGRVLAAEYAGGQGTHRIYRWTPDGGDWRYVNEVGEGVSRTLVKTPLKFARVSSSFNPKRMHPILHKVKGHNGVDYAAPEGTPVWAAADGKIVFRNKKGGAGNMVIVAHPGGMRTLYMHLSRFRDGQKVGDRVRAKTVIGYVGMTGLATGPHLHYGLTINGRYKDPQDVKQHRGPGVAGGERARWKRERAGLKRRLESIVVAAGQDTD